MKRYSSLLVIVSLILSPLQVAAKVLVDSKGSLEQDFVLTSYYSPLPDQCCYIKGSYEDDKILNGEGTHGADGTPVYPGMLAAPPSYPFGTRIVLPGLGIFTVHDRGGAIQEWDKAHRLDVWAGHGEEGLARALAFGVKSIHGQVYLPGTPMPEEDVSLEALAAPLHRLQPYAIHNKSPSITSSSNVAATIPLVAPVTTVELQQKLSSLAYFQEKVTGIYGKVTKAALASFIDDMGLDESSDYPGPKTIVYLDAALAASQASSPIVFIGKESVPSDVVKMQRMMRYLGFYRGRTDGIYSEKLFNAIFAYQKSVGLVGALTSPGAGRIGPMTKEKLDHEIKNRRIARYAQRLLTLLEVKTKLAEADALLATPLSIGSKGTSVRMLQTILAEAGIFPREQINGTYGEFTKKAVVKYQIDRALISSENDKAAGTVGPLTLYTVQQDQAKKALSIVKAQGWEALTSESLRADL